MVGKENEFFKETLNCCENFTVKWNKIVHYNLLDLHVPSLFL